MTITMNQAYLIILGYAALGCISILYTYLKVITKGATKNRINSEIFFDFLLILLAIINWPYILLQRIVLKNES